MKLISKKNWQDKENLLKKFHENS